MTETTTNETAILIVDDEVSLRNTFSIFLKREGYETVIAVGSFKEAMEEVSSRSFDLIICDIVLESHSGIDLLEKFRQLGICCPVVMITGYPQIETAADAVRLGAFDYLAKPVEKDALLKTTRQAIKQFHLEQGKREAELTREQYRLFLETIFRSVSDCIISVDLEMNILKWNQAAALLFHNIQPGLNEGVNLNSFQHNRDLCQLSEYIEKVNKTGLELVDHRVECLFGGKCKLLSICISPLDDGTGELVGSVLVIRDMTYKKQDSLTQRTHFHSMIGASPVMQNVYMMVENIGKVDTSVLITGESGTGKELVVQALHHESPRRNKPLIMVNCTAIPDTLLESELFGHKKGSFTGAEEHRQGRILQADGGTLFLDEIGDISMTMQLRLLRFLQEKTFYPVGGDEEIQVDARVVAATNVDLKEKVKSGSFREDLYFRLLIIDIHLPPLRTRTGDIALLTNHFLHRFASKIGKNISGISEQALTMLSQYQWPGNVRQLEHAIERACILCPDTTISSQWLPEEVINEAEMEQTTSLSLSSGADRTDSDRILEYSLTEQEQETAKKIIAALKKAGGNKAKAARILKVDRSTLYRKMLELHIDRDMFTM